VAISRPGAEGRNVFYARKREACVLPSPTVTCHVSEPLRE